MPSITIASLAGMRPASPAKALVKASNSKEVKDYINKNLVPKGIVPAF